MRIYEWTVAHSASLRRVVARLPQVEPKARFRLQPGKEATFGQLLLTRTQETYDLTLLVPVRGWEEGGDALEPWLASTFFLALDCAERGEVHATGVGRGYGISSQVEDRLSAFQYTVRAELAEADPARLSTMPVGGQAFLRARLGGVVSKPDDHEDGSAYLAEGKLVRWPRPKRIPLPEGLPGASFF
ncbi:MAG TPA: hypothetical protein VJ549_09940 [Geothrix sp.]|nr:hypothetical protein [Geothrix sp.]